MRHWRDARAARGVQVIAAFAFASLASAALAEKFVPLGTQPDGSEVFVQDAAPTTLKGGRRLGWFRTVPKKPQMIANENGLRQSYTEMLALNVADCPVYRMGATAIVYRDSKQKIVARFDLPEKTMEYVDIHQGTLGASMFEWLCAAPKTSASKVGAPAKPAAAPPPVPNTSSPFK